MIIVTGAAGFIGSNLLKGLNRMGYDNIIAVDDLTYGRKFQNLAAAKIKDYLDYEDFHARLQADQHFAQSVKAIFHQGACSATTEWDGRYMMKNNYAYSKTVLHYCLRHNIQFLYASSAAVYGADTQFDDTASEQTPLNVYGYSKWLFDEYVQSYLKKPTTQIVGLRYFNAYGPHEQHKGSMASVAFHLMNQLHAGGTIRLFEGAEGYGDGEQLRDFVNVDDVVRVNLWFLDNPSVHGIYNCGTGKARTFNAVANTLLACHGSGRLEYIPFPEHLKGAYQSYTQANITKLRQAGYTAEFDSLEVGLQKYYQWYVDTFARPVDQAVVVS